MVLGEATDFDTINTVVERCRFVANSLDQQYIIITADEAIFCKLMELKYANADLRRILIVRLGGLHTAMAFMKAIGKHVKESGLTDLKNVGLNAKC